jgi:hypothetical protein
LAHHSISTSLATTTRCKNSFAHSPDYTQPPPPTALAPHLCPAVSRRSKNIFFHLLQSVACLFPNCSKLEPIPKPDGVADNFRLPQGASEEAVSSAILSRALRRPRQAKSAATPSGKALAGRLAALLRRSRCAEASLPPRAWPSDPPRPCATS